MVEYNKVNVKLSNSDLSKLKIAAKNQTGVTLRMNIKMFNGNNLAHELLLATRQKTKLRNAFENNINELAGPLMEVAVPPAKNISVPLGITAAASAVDEETQKKIHGSGTTILTISMKK